MESGGDQPFGATWTVPRNWSGGQQRLPEESVFRIDHYLGKETVQGHRRHYASPTSSTSRSRNSHYVDSVDHDGRGHPVSAAGKLRRHQRRPRRHSESPAATAGSPRWRSRSTSGPEEVQSRRRSRCWPPPRLAQPLDATGSRGQSTLAGGAAKRVIGLLEEDGFSHTSTTETFAAITLDVDTRQAWVPFYHAPEAAGSPGHEIR